MGRSQTPAIRWFIGDMMSGLTAWVLVAGSMAFAQEPLFQRIDATLATSQTGPATTPASDAEFLRRATLDLVGTLPTPAETKAFLADQQPDKRTRVIDQLLADARFPFHWAEVFDVMLMERRQDKYVPHAEWIKYLQASFQQNKPWNLMVREMFTADGTDPATRPAAKFFLDRDAEPHIVTRDVGRIFFGVDLQCAQCHNHPLVDHYLQSDYYGIFAFVSRTVLFHDEPAKLWHLGEKAEGNADYQSVFTKDASRSRPRLPGGLELEEPHFALGDEYVVAPADKVRPVPKFSRRALLAKATEGGNAAFDRNLPNRLWANLMGRGLVHPVDWQHPHNPPSSPATLDLITQEFVASGYNIKTLIHQIVLTQAYQRSIDPPADRTARLANVTAQLAPLDQKILELEAVVKTTSDQQTALYQEMQTARNALAEPDQAYQKAVQAALALKKPWTDAQAALAKTQADTTAKQAVIAALTEAHAKAAEAVKLLPNDAEVTQAAKVFETKVATSNTELAALQKTAADQTVAVEAARVKWQEGVTASEAAYATYVAATATWEGLKPKWNEARQAELTAAAQLEALKLQRDHWQQSVDYASTLAQLAAAQAAMPVAQAELTQAQQLMTEQQAVVNTATTAVTTATSEVQTAQQQLDAAKTELANRQATAKPVSDAVADLDVALQKLAGDAELTEVQAKLKARYEPLGSAIKEAEAVMTAKTAEHQAVTTKLQTAQQTLHTATAELTVRQQAVATKTTAVTQAQTKISEVEVAVRGASDKLSISWEQEFVTRVEKALTPEQLTYAMLQATGILEPQIAAADAEIEKTVPKASVADDPAKQATRQFQVLQLVRERMRGNVNAFITLYGGGAGQPQDQFFATVDQALFVANGGTVRSWVNPSGNNLAARLVALTEPAAIAEELYVSVLGRPPRPEEVSRVTEYLTARANERPQAIQEILWATLSSVEFRFNL